MKDVKFLQVGMKNYCCYINEMVFDFRDNKIVLFVGPNGVGKSSIFDCLPYTLYGVTSKGQHGDDVVNDVIMKDCHTWLTFEVDDVPYRVDRFHKHRIHGNTVLLYMNDMINPIKKGHREVLPEIERILIPQKLFMNTLLFGQEVKNFFTDLTDTEKKEIFRKILQLDNWVLYYNETSNKIKQISEDLDEIRNKLSVNRQLLSDAKLQVNILNESKLVFERNKVKEISQYQYDIVKLKSELDGFSKEVENLKEQTSDIEDLFREISKIEREISIIDLNLGSFYQDLNNKKIQKFLELRNSMSEFSEETNRKYNELQSKLTGEFNLEKDRISSELLSLSNERNKLDSQVAEFVIKINILREQNEEIRENVIDKDVAICPTCYQEINSSVIQNLKKKMTAIKNEILTLIEKKEESESVIRMINTKRDELVVEVSRTKEKTEGELSSLDKEKQLEIQKVQERGNELLDQVENLSKKEFEKETRKSSEKMKLLKLKKQDLEDEHTNKKHKIEEIETLEKQISRIESESMSLEGLLSHRREEEYDDSQLKAYIGKIKLIDSEIKNLEYHRNNLEEKMKVLEFWKVGFSSVGIPSLLIDESIPFMNKQVSYYLDKISNGRYIVSFDTLKATKEGEFRDKVSVNVLDNFTKANSRVKLSGGQTRLVDIATILTLCDLQSDIQDIKFNIILFDEIFDSLDDENITYVSNLLRTIVVDKSINIISHRHIDQIDADEVLSFF